MAELIRKDELLEELNDMVYNRQNADELHCEVKNLVHVMTTITESEIRAKAYERFAEKLKNKLVLKYGNATPTEQYVAMQVDVWCNEIAEQLKEE